MVLGFNKMFQTPILEDVKVHTIRVDAHDRWKPGNSIQFATGVRSPNYNCFKEGTCISTQKIRISYDKRYILPYVFVDGKSLSSKEILELAVKDGFNDIEAFFQWFNEDFNGKIIHWTDHKY